VWLGKKLVPLLMVTWQSQLILMFSEIMRNITIGDYITFSTETNVLRIVEVVEVSCNQMKVKTFLPMDSAILQSYTLPPLNPRYYLL
jgi:hypothetical protein